MRIVAGQLGGRHFDSPGSDRTHPMSDKMRGALFNILGDLSGLSVLDAFGGSGALSFEAISRGATNVIVLDDHKAAQQTIAKNIKALALGDHIALAQTSASTWLQTNPGATFDIMLCDPPYDNHQPTLLASLSTRVAPGGLLVLSYPAIAEPPVFGGLERIKQQTYGDAQLLFYRKMS